MTRRLWLASLPAAASLKAYQSPAWPFERIDTHTHIHRKAPALFAALEKDQWRCLSICVSRAVGNEPSDLEEMIRGGVESRNRKTWFAEERRLRGRDCVRSADDSGSRDFRETNAIRDVRSDGEIVDGHLRLKGALKLGMTEVPRTDVSYPRRGGRT